MGILCLVGCGGGGGLAPACVVDGVMVDAGTVQNRSIFPGMVISSAMPACGGTARSCDGDRTCTPHTRERDTVL